MKAIRMIWLSLLISCSDQSNKSTFKFKLDLPDTSKSWSGQMTRDDYYLTRDFEKNLHLQTLINGVKNQEIRVWSLSDSYDPQILFILNKNITGRWRLRTISFYKTKADSIYTDYTRQIRVGAVDSLRLERFFNLASQSDLKKSDNYGCMDGENVFVEIANSTKYRFMWYRCPDINKAKDSSFMLISQLRDQLNALAVEH
ncbi:MAG: hypothetical protein JWP69_2309 [Flaviaesturariibacter sp.]|nr:hypothetical protein [Flaviaesturariibacter sp.]